MKLVISLVLCLMGVRIAKSQVNIALGKPTAQESTFDNAVSSYAVDGNTSSCSQTESRPGQIWVVDLGAKYSINEVVIYSSERLQNILVFIVPLNIFGLQLCDKNITSSMNGSKEVFQCGGIEGNSVFIVRTDNESLSLCEVEIFPTQNGDCGAPAISHFEGNTKIVGGRDARPGSWPWMVQIRLLSDYYKCGGSLINHRWIVTAAHCFGSNLDPSFWTIAIGSHNRDKVDEGEMRVDVDLIILHENYTSRYLYNDIALMRLAEPVVFNDTVSPVCLPEEDVPAETLCYVTGWGATKNTGFDGILKQAHVQIISNEVCNQIDYYDGTITENMLCAGYEEGIHDSCEGDSGGPLVCQGEDDKWEIQGIVSKGYDCGLRKKPGIYTRVTRYTAWIIEQLALHP